MSSLEGARYKTKGQVILRESKADGVRSTGIKHVWVMFSLEEAR
jgi:hypothetical protein